MPAIRDFTFANTTTTTGTQIYLFTPSVVVGDLLLAILTADTGTGTWSSPGWSVVTGWPLTNTVQQCLMWKIADASDITSGSYLFTRSTAETFTGTLLSIMDVDTSNPFGVGVVRSVVAQASAAKFVMPQITTTADNSLVLYAASSSAASVPSLIEGPVFGLIGQDGAAEGHAIGWGFKSQSGTTPNNVVYSAVSTGGCVKSALMIAPPESGATVIPTYCAQDDSLYLNPLNGTTAFNGDVAVAATADTNYGTTLGGYPAGDAAVAAATDVGINPYHSVARLTSISATSTLAGAEMVFGAANRPNLDGKNILVHVGPSTEGQIQRFSAASSGRGIWFGVRSNTASGAASTGYKLYQVRGVEQGAGRHWPVVINPSATTTKAKSGTLDASVIASVGFWVAGNGISTTVWDFAQLWMIDTVTICGGNAAQPINLKGIEAAAAIGHERRSVIVQGTGQLIAYQPLQIGNGGSERAYLGLDATAIEFPRQYNLQTLDLAYHSIDNYVGITYYAGPDDTINHTDSVISSLSRYHWRIHASSSALASYDFSGLSVIGAGDVVLRPVTTFTGMSFTDCTTVTQNSAQIESCTFEDALIVSDTPSYIALSDFISSGTGHAVEITTPGEYTIVGNTFTGYGATGTANAAIYNNSGGAVTLNVVNGSAPTYRNGSGATTTVIAAAGLTLTDLKIGSEVRAYVGTDPATATEISGIESVASSDYTFSQSVSGQAGYIQIFHVDYQPLIINLTYASTDASIPVQQVFDRNFNNQ